MANNLKKNELVVYRKRRESCLGIVSSLSEKKINIFSEDGKEVSVDQRKIVLNTDIFIETTNPSEKKSTLRQYRKNLEENKDLSDLVALWECFEDLSASVSFNDLLELYSSGDQLENSQRLQLFWTIDKDDIYFKREEEHYLPISRKDVENILERRERKKQKEAETERAMSWIKNYNNHRYLEESDFNKDHYINLIKHFVVKQENLDNSKETKHFLSEIGVKDLESATKLLINLGVWDENSDPDIKRLETLEPFPQKAMEEAAEIISKDDTFSDHEDLANLKIFSVDDETTKDIDDAISVEFIDDIVEIGIHISNVAHYINKWDALDREALRRGDTVYIPERRIDLFPEELINKKLSLFENIPKSSISLIASFDKESFELKTYRFTRAKINVCKNYSYDEAAELFSKEVWGKYLFELAQKLKERRLKNGAFILQLPELKIIVNKNNEITVKKNFMDSVAHFVISELMILTNQIAARFLIENSTHGIFRTQTEEVSEEAREMDMEDPLFPIKIIKHLRPSRNSIDPEKHSSLGLQSYLQSTSPIRRYLDLVIQRQILSIICDKKDPYSEEELKEIIAKVGHGLSDRRNLQKARNRYWLFKYLGNSNLVLNGVVHYVGERKISVYLPDYFFEIDVSNIKENNFSSGDKITMKLSKVDPLNKRMNVEINDQVYPASQR